MVVVVEEATSFVLGLQGQRFQDAFRGAAESGQGPGCTARGAEARFVPRADETCERGGHVPGAGCAVAAHDVQRRDEGEADGGVVSGQDLGAVREEEGFHLAEDLVVASQHIRMEQIREREENLW